MLFRYKYFRTYFYLNFIISISLPLFLGSSTNSIVMTWFPLSTFPIFVYVYFISFLRFSDEIELKYPALFKKYKSSFGYTVQRINGFELFNNPDFEKLEDVNLVERYMFTKKMLGLTALSFFSILIFTIVLYMLTNTFQL